MTCFLDAEPGSNRSGQPHSVVNSPAAWNRVALLANGLPAAGLGLIDLGPTAAVPAVLVLVLACCAHGYSLPGSSCG